MIPNFSTPFSAFTHGDNNPASFAIAQHYHDRDAAIEELVELYKQHIDIGHPDVFNAVLAKHNMGSDGFEDEDEYIIAEVGKRIRRI
jgi:hypothetical protein